MKKEWTKNVVLVTGGSAGLGLAIAREFGQLGAIPVLLGRDIERSRGAVKRLADEGIRADAVSADVTELDQVESAVAQVVERFDRLDVLINNVGRSVRVDLMSARSRDYREFMEINFFSVVNCTQAALPHLQKASGHVVNIGSLASKTAWPYLAPYSASKFALAAYTHQLRLEGPRNVHYMLVCPGPIQRVDSKSRYEEASTQIPSSFKKPGGGARVEGIRPEKLAKKILHGIHRRKREMVVPFRARILFAISAYSPPIGDWILKRLMRN